MSRDLDHIVAGPMDLPALPDFEIVRVRSGAWSIRSRRFGEVCHPGSGPYAEAEALYVHGLDLPARMQASRSPFVVWDVGLGGAANAVAIIQAARPLAVSLHVISFDLSLAQLEFAVSHAETLEYFGDLAGIARRLLDEPTLEFRHGAAMIRWDRILTDFPQWLRSAKGASDFDPDAILFDPHSPAANPEMWTLPLFAALARRIPKERPSSLATYSRSTAVRSALLLGGWYVGYGPRIDSREETTVAANQPALAGRLLDQRWLLRARRSHAAEPWIEPPFIPRPLTDDNWAKLRDHPQFTG